MNGCISPSLVGKRSGRRKTEFTVRVVWEPLPEHGSGTPSSLSRLPIATTQLRRRLRRLEEHRRRRCLGPKQEEEREGGGKYTSEPRRRQDPQRAAPPPPPAESQQEAGVTTACMLLLRRLLLRSTPRAARSFIAKRKGRKTLKTATLTGDLRALEPDSCSGQEGKDDQRFEIFQKKQENRTAAAGGGRPPCRRRAAAVSAGQLALPDIPALLHSLSLDFVCLEQMRVKG
jgi:hypothetical protein